jgi:hypothetical protein
MLPPSEIEGEQGIQDAEAVVADKAPIVKTSAVDLIAFLPGRWSLLVGRLPVMESKQEVADVAPTKVAKAQWNVGILAGGMFAPGIQTSPESTFGAQGGLYLERHFPGDRLSVFAELQYQWVQLPEIGLDTAAEVTAGFGLDHNQFRRVTQSAHLVRLPLGVRWRTASGWSFEGGLGAQYLAALRGQLWRDDALQPWERNGTQIEAQAVAVERFYSNALEPDYNDFPRVYESTLVESGWLNVPANGRLQGFALVGAQYAITPKWIVSGRMEYAFGNLLPAQPATRWPLSAQLRMIYLIR